MEASCTRDARPRTALYARCATDIMSCRSAARVLAGKRENIYSCRNPNALQLNRCGLEITTCRTRQVRHTAGVRNRIKIGFAAVLLGIAGMIAWQISRGREPVYQGKPLGRWLAGYITSGSVIDVYPEIETDEAVRRMGASAIPSLLRMLRARDSQFKRALWWFSDRQHWIQIRPFPAVFTTRQAATAFRALGGAASDAVPALIRIYRDNISPDSQGACVEAMGGIGPAASAAIPDMMSAAAQSNHYVRAVAVLALGHIHARPDLVLPMLLRSLEDSDVRVRLGAAVALAEFGADAFPVVSRLMDLVLTNANQAAAAALANLSPDGSLALSQALTNRNATAARESGDARRFIIKALADRAFSLHYSEDPFAEGLVRLSLMHRYRLKRFPGGLAQLRIDAGIAVPALLQCLESPDADLRLTAAVALVGFGASSDRITQVFRGLREHKSTAYWRLCTALDLNTSLSGEQAYPDPSITLPWLVKKLQTEDEGLREAVTSALIAIDPVAAAEAGINTNQPSP